MTKTSEKQQLAGAIGIFLSREKWQELMAGTPGAGLAEMLHAADDLGLSPLWFSLPQKYLQEGVLEGAVRKKGKLVPGKYPVPQVVYDRGVFAKQDRPDAKRIREALTECGVKYVNSISAFSKWATHLVLAEDSSVMPYLPATTSFCNVADYEEMLGRYPKLCVKSYWGSRGKEVLFVEKRVKGFNLIYPDGTCKAFGLPAELAEAVGVFMRGQKYIIQERINLATWKQRRFDIRVLLQKKSLNEWGCTVICLRLAQIGQGITSTSHGSKVMEAKHVLEDLWPGRSEQIIAEIENLSYRVAETLEARHGPLGELGLDVGVDHDGRIWLFEVNGKPGKVTARKLKQERLVQLAYRRPLAYAQLLLEGK